MKYAILLTAILLAGCSTEIESNVIPLSADTASVLVTTRCGHTAAQQAAFEHAAVATIDKGFDRFIVLGTHSASDIDTTTVPTQVHTTYTGHTSTSYVTGGYTVVDEKPRHALTIQMFRQGNPAGANAIDAREALGENWKTVVENGGPDFCS